MGLACRHPMRSVMVGEQYIILPLPGGFPKMVWISSGCRQVFLLRSRCQRRFNEIKFLRIPSYEGFALKQIGEQRLPARCVTVVQSWVATEGYSPLGVVDGLNRQTSYVPLLRSTSRNCWQFSIDAPHKWGGRTQSAWVLVLETEADGGWRRCSR